MARRKCYGYEVDPDGELVVNPGEAQVVCWIFEQYLSGKSLGKNYCWIGTAGHHFPHRQTEMGPGGD